MNIEQELTTFVVADLSHGAVNNLDPNDDLIESGVIDSFGIVELLTFIEQRLGVSIPPDDVIPENFRSIRSLTALIETLRASAG